MRKRESIFNLNSYSENYIWNNKILSYIRPEFKKNKKQKYSTRIKSHRIWMMKVSLIDGKINWKITQYKLQSCSSRTLASQSWVSFIYKGLIG